MSEMHFDKINEDFVINSSSFCLMPWVHFHVTQYGTVTPCCQAPWKEEEAFGNINKQTIAEIWNSAAIKKFRLKMLNGEYDERCSRCHVMEKAQLYSLRKATNVDYIEYLDRAKETQPDGASLNTAPVYFDIRFSNHCNFKCRICGPWSSSTWFNDARQMGFDEKNLRLTHGIDDMDLFMKQLRQILPHAKEIYFAGGEPLMMEEHYLMLDTLIEMGLTNVFLRYNTNFSIFEFRGKSIFDYWKNFSNVFLCASLDDNHKRGELQRKGQVWDDVVLNRERLMAECPNVDFMLAPTLSIMNIFNLPSFHREWVRLGLMDVSEIWPSILQQPEEYNIRSLTPDAKKEITEIYSNHINWILEQSSADEAVKQMVAVEFKNCINFMNGGEIPGKGRGLKELTKTLDNLRQEDLPSILPELKALLED